MSPDALDELAEAPCPGYEHGCTCTECQEESAVWAVAEMACWDDDEDADRDDRQYGWEDLDAGELFTPAEYIPTFGELIELGRVRRC